MASFLIGVVLFALGIALTIALHEAGHLIAARSCGMRVRQYFVGFGPRIFSFRRGHTEYGLRAIPFGGFCEIAGMTPNDPLTPDEEPCAMCRQGPLKRIAVMLAGIAVNLVLGTVVIYLVAVLGQVPNPDADRSARVGETVCTTEGEDCVGPAEAAGVEPGDRIVALDSRRVATFPELQSRLARHEPGAEVALRVERGGQTLELPVTLAESSGGSAALGVVSAPIDEPVASYGPVDAVPATVKLVGQTMVATVDAVARLPETIPGVAAAVAGAERAPDSPMSVVGASRVGGELVEYRAWDAFFLMLANLNFFLALFNLIPLPPFDGGHVAVVIAEKIRDRARRARGLKPKGPIDYRVLMPVTAAAAFVLLGVGVLVIVADLVNPVRLLP